MSEFVNSIVTTFNNLFSYNDTNITIIFDQYNKLWFSLTDVFKALGYSSPNKEIKRLDINQEYISTYNDIYNQLPKKYINFKKPKNIQPHMKMTNETGIYIILSKSIKPIAKKFKDSLYEEIIPKLRENGEYKFSLNDKRKLNTLSKRTKIYKQEIKRTLKHSYPDKTKKGFIYVLKVKTIHDGKKKICYKVGYTANLEQRLATYKTGNPDAEIAIAHQENLHCDKEQLESCLLNLNHLKLLKEDAEIICNISLKKIKDEIKDCKKLLEKHAN